MVSQLYQHLADIGYHHPLHPALTHLPVGLTLAAVIFVFISYVRRRQDYAQTAHHCAVLAMLTAVPTIVMGYLDWQHFYAGAMIFPIKVKLALAAALFLLLVVAYSMGRRRRPVKMSKVSIHLLGALAAAGLGFFGGELVYGKKAAAPVEQVIQPAVGQPVTADASAAGEAIFAQSCSFCHFTDSNETKVGPGLKGFFQKAKMTASGWPVNPENVRKQIRTPFEQMPAFESLTDAEIDALIDYMKTL